MRGSTRDQSVCRRRLAVSDQRPEPMAQGPTSQVVSPAARAIAAKAHTTRATHRAAAVDASRGCGRSRRTRVKVAPARTRIISTIPGYCGIHSASAETMRRRELATRRACPSPASEIRDISAQAFDLLGATPQLPFCLDRANRPDARTTRSPSATVSRRGDVMQIFVRSRVAIVSHRIATPSRTLK